jgi:uncharacterized protein (TIGR03492 family)
MAHHRCRLVAVRDRLTARGLRRHHVAALAPGNPMMDGFRPDPLPPWLRDRRRILLLAGSRMPEAARNMVRLLEALPHRGVLPVGARGNSDAPLTVLVATGNVPRPGEMAPLLDRLGFEAMTPPQGSQADSAWERGALQLLIGRGRFSEWAPWAEMGMATAGTATEQLVGLGVPALSLPGRGPQFQAGFALRQSRLLGGAVEPCRSPREMGERLAALLGDPAERSRLGGIGRRRMGPSGGSKLLASLIGERLLGACGPPGQAEGQGQDDGGTLPPF